MNSNRSNTSRDFDAKKKSEKLPKIRILKSIDRDDPFFKSVHFKNNEVSGVKIPKNDDKYNERKMGLICSDDSYSSGSEATDNEEVKKIDI